MIGFNVHSLPRTWGARVDLEKAEAARKSGAARCVKCSYIAGYVSRKIPGIAFKYSGRYGDGFAILRPTRKSSFFSLVEYYIFKSV